MSDSSSASLGRLTSRAVLASTIALLLALGSAPVAAAQEDLIDDVRIQSAIFDRDADRAVVTFSMECVQDAFVRMKMFLVQGSASAFVPREAWCVADSTLRVPLNFGNQEGAFKPGEATFQMADIAAYTADGGDGASFRGTTVNLIAEPAPGSTCVRFTVKQAWNPAGSDNGSNLVNEWVRIKNYCSTAKSISEWKVWDRGKVHTYTFASGTVIEPGQAIKLRTGDGDDTASNVYWDQGSAVWNNTRREKAYLYSPVSGTVKDTWTRR